MWVPLGYFAIEKRLFVAQLRYNSVLGGSGKTSFVLLTYPEFLSPVFQSILVFY